MLAQVNAVTHAAGSRSLHRSLKNAARTAASVCVASAAHCVATSARWMKYYLQIFAQIFFFLFLLFSTRCLGHFKGIENEFSINMWPPTLPTLTDVFCSSRLSLAVTFIHIFLKKNTTIVCEYSFFPKRSLLVFTSKPSDLLVLLLRRCTFLLALPHPGCSLLDPVHLSFLLFL